MKDTEVVKMAAFKLHECADRMLVLARTAESVALRTTFLAVRLELIKEEQRLHGLGGLAVSPVTHPRSRRGRRPQDAAITSTSRQQAMKPAAA
jgi:hypothetical protein